MPQLLIILVFLLVSAPEMLGLGQAAPALGVGRVAAWTVGLQVALCLPAWAVAAGCVRAVDRTGSMRAVRLGERVSLLLRWTSVGVHAGTIFGLGWVAAVRSISGDLVLVDEVVAVLPVLGVWVFSWWMIEPLERRLHEALILRKLDDGAPVYPVLTRWRFVWMTVRHQVLVLVVPLMAILAWSETLERWARGHLAGGGAGDWRLAAAQLVGVGAAMMLMPPALVRIWDTATLGPGDLRDRVADLCSRARVRVRDVLVWRTNGRVANAAAVGLVRPLRYILLSDALLDHLTSRQVEAVAAHEIGHVKRRHMLWLGVVMLATLLGASSVMDAALESARHVPATALLASLPEAMLTPWVLGVIVGASIVVFGFVSRRFEWQADAFAAQSLSEGEGNTAGVVTAEAVAAMAGALGAVAALSGAERRRFSWRHGSIASRQRRLIALVGRPAHRLAIDRQAGMIKLAALLVLAGSIAWLAWGPRTG